MSNPDFTYKQNVLLQSLRLDVGVSWRFSLILGAIYVLAVINLYLAPLNGMLNGMAKPLILLVITVYTGWVVYRHLWLKNHPLQGCSLKNDGSFVRDHRVVATLIEEYSNVYAGFIVLHADLKDRNSSLISLFSGNKATLAVFSDAIDSNTYRRLKIYFQFRGTDKVVK